MPSATIWRFLITAVNTSNTGIGSGANTVSIGEVVYYDSAGTVISTSGGTASSSSDLGTDVHTKAFDGNNTTWWTSSGSPSSGSPEWLQMQFASPVAVDHFSLSFIGGTTGWAPADFSLQYFNGASYVTVYSYQGALRMTGLYTNTFYTSGVVYRLSVSAIQSGSDRVLFSNLKFFDASNTLITGVLGNGFATSWDGSTIGPNPTQAYNSTCSSYYASTPGAPSSGSQQWIAFQFPAGTAPASFSFQTANNVNGPADAPATFTLQSSLDGVNFTTVASYTAATWTTTCQTQTFSITAPSIVLSPSSGFEGKTYTVNVTGSGTHFVGGTTTVSFGGAGGTVSSVSVTDSTHLTFTLALSGSAAVGPQTVTVTTGSEAPTASFTVFAIVFVAKRDDLGWSQIRLGTDGCFGDGPFGQATDGSGAPGLLATWDSHGNLIASGTAAAGAITTITVNGA